MSYRESAKHECPACGIQMVQREPTPPKPPWLSQVPPMRGAVAVMLATASLLTLLVVVNAWHVEVSETVERARENEEHIRLIRSDIAEMQREYDFEITDRSLHDIHLEADVERLDRQLYQLRHPAVLREYEGPPIYAGADWCCVASGSIYTYTCVHRQDERVLVVPPARARSMTLGLIQPPQSTFWSRR